MSEKVSEITDSHYVRGIYIDRIINTLLSYDNISASNSEFGKQRVVSHIGNCHLNEVCRHVISRIGSVLFCIIPHQEFAQIA